jgi:hypothetical protein
MPEPSQLLGNTVHFPTVGSDKRVEIGLVKLLYDEADAIEYGS